MDINSDKNEITLTFRGKVFKLTIPEVILEEIQPYDQVIGIDFRLLYDPDQTDKLYYTSKSDRCFFKLDD